MPTIFGFVWNCLETFDLDGHSFVSSKFLSAFFPKNLIASIFHIFSSGALNLSKEIVPLLHGKFLGILQIIVLVENE